MSYLQIGFIAATTALMLACIAYLRSTHLPAGGLFLAFLVLFLCSQASGYLPFIVFDRQSTLVDGRFFDAMSMASHVLELLAWSLLLRFVLVVRTLRAQLPKPSSGSLQASSVKPDAHDSRSAMSGRQMTQLVLGIICFAFLPILAILQLADYYKPPLYQWILVGVLTFPTGFRCIRRARASVGARPPSSEQT